MIHFWKMYLKDICPKLNNSHKFLGGDSLTKIFLSLPLLLHLFPMMVQGDTASVRSKPPPGRGWCYCRALKLKLFQHHRKSASRCQVYTVQKKKKKKKFNLLAKLTKLVETDKCINQFLEISNSLRRMSDQ